jgi:long-chain acyl-CoA synthetase
MVDHPSGEERFLSVLPLSHSYGLMTGLILPVALASTIILRPHFEAKDTLEAIRQHQPTVFSGVPSIFLALANYPGVRGYGVSSIKFCLSGSEPLPVEVQEQFEKLTRGRLVEGYGLTEASPVTHVNPLGGQRRTGSIGLPLPSTEARIVDLKTGQREVPAGQFGELLVRGPQVMLGYWNDPEGTRAVLDEVGWLRTGDIALMDEDGYFRIIARKADMWLAEGSGEPAFPRDVEEVLYEVPQVKEAVVMAFAG